MSALGVLIVPAILVAGYYGRVLASSAEGDDCPPSFDRPGALFVEGLETWAVVTGYAALALVLLAALGMAALFLGTLGTGAGSVVGLVALVVAGVVAIGLFMGPAWFFLPAALAHAARTDDIGAALELRAVGRIAVQKRYLARWLAGGAVLLVGSAVYAFIGSGLHGLVSVIGWLGAPSTSIGSTGVAAVSGHALGAAVNFYCQVVAFHLFGRGYGAALDALEGPESRERERAQERKDDREWGAAAREWRERRWEERRSETRRGRG